MHRNRLGVESTRRGSDDRRGILWIRIVGASRLKDRLLRGVFEAILVRDVLDFESIISLSILYAKCDSLFREFWNFLGFCSFLICEIKMRRFYCDRDDCVDVVGCGYWAKRDLFDAFE